jgi:hypothetical protein
VCNITLLLKVWQVCVNSFVFNPEHEGTKYNMQFSSTAVLCAMSMRRQHFLKLDVQGLNEDGCILNSKTCSKNEF